MKPDRSSIRCVFAVAVLLLSGCASNPDQFYMLTSDGSMPASGAAESPPIVVGPVTIPDYIDRAELVFQSAPNRFEVPPEHRWAGALDKTVTDVLATNLGHRLKTAAIHSFPWDSSSSLTPRYAIPVRIRQFHALSGGDAILDVRWEVRDPKTNRTLHRGAQVFSEELTEEGYEGVVKAQSRLLGQLADAIAAMLR